MSQNKNESKIKEVDAEVLYQKLGDRWFAFSIIGDEVFMAPVPEEQIHSIRRGEREPVREFGNHEAA
jgi:hypothetical protein